MSIQVYVLQCKCVLYELPVHRNVEVHASHYLRPCYYLRGSALHGGALHADRSWYLIYS